MKPLLWGTLLALVVILFTCGAVRGQDAPVDSAAVPAEEGEPAAEPDEEPEEKEPPPKTGIRVAGMAVCVAIEDRVPVGESEVFSSDVGALYCFTAVQGADPPTQVFHRWYVGERMINEIPINVKGERWRCWSRKTILPRWKGSCRVEVLTEEGDVLGVREFRLE
jgi:hypothetical protein